MPCVYRKKTLDLPLHEWHIIFVGQIFRRGIGGEEQYMKITNIKGIKKAAAATKHLTGYYGPMCVQMIYNRTTGEISTHDLVGHNSWIDLSDRPEDINVGLFYEPTTTQNIVERVNAAVSEYNTLTASK